MAISVNGTVVPWGVIATVAAALVGYGALQFQVSDNQADLHEHKDLVGHPETATNVAVLSTSQAAIQNDLRKIEAHTKAQTELLNQVVYQLAELNAKAE